MVNNHHDTGYKELFSYPEFVQQLIEGFAPAEIAQLMDFSTLKSHSGHYITPLFEEKIEDVVWSVNVNWQGATQEVYLYILLEFQSSVDRTMPVRLLHYTACFYSELLTSSRQARAYRWCFRWCFITAWIADSEGIIEFCWLSPSCILAKRSCVACRGRSKQPRIFATEL